MDPEHRAFLSYANGWPDFHQVTDLLSLEGIRDLRKQILDSSSSDSADEELSEDVYQVTDLLPIAASGEDIDIFVMPIIDKQVQSEVIWLAGGEIDRYSSFVEFFASMIEYAKELTQDVRAGKFQ